MKRGRIGGGCKREVTESLTQQLVPCLQRTTSQRGLFDPSKETAGANTLQAALTVTAASQPGLTTDKRCYLCTPTCEPYTSKSSLIKILFQRTSNTIIWTWNLQSAEILFPCEDFSLFFGTHEQPLPPVLSFSLTHTVWRGQGEEWRQKQTGVQVCDVWHVHTASVHHGGRRQVWQQRLPDHDYIISQYAAEGEPCKQSQIQERRRHPKS